jgi:hypothetical protein
LVCGVRVTAITFNLLLLRSVWALNTWRAADTRFISWVQTTGYHVGTAVSHPRNGLFRFIYILSALDFPVPVRHVHV